MTWGASDRDELHLDAAMVKFGDTLFYIEPS
jgi:hypothetical protein